MKVFIAVFLALAFVSVNSDDKYERMLKKWGKMKAMEGCFGEENMGNWIMMMKKAKAKCSGKPAPELSLPMFKNKVRTVNALLKGNSQSQQNEFIHAMMRKAFVKNLMRQQMSDLFSDDEFFGKMKSRFTREADDDDMEDELNLADKMVEKLGRMEEMFMTDIGNMTCVLQEVGAINEDMEIDVAAMDKMADMGKWKPEEAADGVDRQWLHAKSKKIHAMCKDLSDAVPESILNACEMPHYLTRIIYFKKCKMFHKIEACMHSDVMHKISKHMDIDELAENMDKSKEQIAALMSAVLFTKM